eukprot:357977-Chlamydomonas_euryale.AAC.6
MLRRRALHRRACASTRKLHACTPHGALARCCRTRTRCAAQARACTTVFRWCWRSCQTARARRWALVRFSSSRSRRTPRGDSWRRRWGFAMRSKQTARRDSWRRPWGLVMRCRKGRLHMATAGGGAGEFAMRSRCPHARRLMRHNRWQCLLS